MADSTHLNMLAETIIFLIISLDRGDAEDYWLGNSSNEKLPHGVRAA